MKQTMIITTNMDSTIQAQNAPETYHGLGFDMSYFIISGKLYFYLPSVSQAYALNIPRDTVLSDEVVDIIDEELYGIVYEGVTYPCVSIQGLVNLTQKEKFSY